MGRHSAVEDSRDMDSYAVGEWAEAQENHRLLSNAWGLLGDGLGGEWDTNSEYARGIFELVADQLQFDKDKVAALLRLSEGMNVDQLDSLLRLLQDGRR